MPRLNRYLVLLAATLVACKGKENGPTELGPPASMSISPAAPTAPANTEVGAITLTVLDANGNPLPNQVVTFTVTAGGGSLTGTSTATTGANGTLIVPPWKLGKLDVAQTLQATTGGVTFSINAVVQTSYNLVVRFYGAGNPSAAQQALFTNAAARIRGVVTGELQNVASGTNFDISACTPGQTTTISETIDDVVIYVRLENIDGPGNILASAGPCFVRSGGPNVLTTVIGTMQFDTSDLGLLREETILHEMLHVVGVGAMWVDPQPDGWGLIQGAGGPTPRYTGANGRQGCQEVGGTVTCATSVPVEDTLGPGTRDTHWEENDFNNELMTGFIEPAAVPMPLSLMTVRSLIDIGYSVNLANFDSYTKPFGAIRAAEGVTPRRTRWEAPASVPVFAIDANGRVVRQLRRVP